MLADCQREYGETMKAFKQAMAPTPMSRVVRGGFPDRQFDVDFWQQQSDAAIFEAAWEMVEIAEAFKGTRVELRPDFKDFLRLLNKHQVKYLIVGGYAVMKYTEPFYTKDLDIWIDATPDNARPMSPARVDVMTSIDAVVFSEAWKDRVQTSLDDIPISIISLEHLKQNKRSANRDTDKIHLARLEKYSKSSN